MLSAADFERLEGIVWNVLRPQRANPALRVPACDFLVLSDRRTLLDRLVRKRATAFGMVRGWLDFVARYRMDYVRLQSAEMPMEMQFRLAEVQAALHSTIMSRVAGLRTVLGPIAGSRLGIVPPIPSGEGRTALESLDDLHSWATRCDEMEGDRGPCASADLINALFELLNPRVASPEQEPQESTSAEASGSPEVVHEQSPSKPRMARDGSVCILPDGTERRFRSDRSDAARRAFLAALIDLNQASTAKQVWARVKQRNSTLPTVEQVYAREAGKLWAGEAIVGPILRIDPPSKNGQSPLYSLAPVDLFDIEAA